VKLSDVSVPLKEVEGYPQLRVSEPGITELANIAERFRDFDPSGENAADTVYWFVTNYIRDADGQPLEDVKKETILVDVKNSMILSAIKACRGEADIDEDSLPE